MTEHASKPKHRARAVDRGQVSGRKLAEAVGIVSPMQPPLHQMNADGFRELLRIAYERRAHLNGLIADAELALADLERRA